MFKFYRDSQICYAYLEDVPPPLVPEPQDAVGSAFASSRWFTRGWTLQELLAAPMVRFYDRVWNYIGDKAALSSELENITGIDKLALHNGRLDRYSIGERMGWASRRETTRTEDLAYSLLGIFDVNMPMLYGEGDQAFIRLQRKS